MPGPVWTALSIAAEFPEHYVLETIAVRRDTSLLITVAIRGQLYYGPATRAGSPAISRLVHTFDELAGGIAELQRERETGRVDTARHSIVPAKTQGH